MMRNRDFDRDVFRYGLWILLEARGGYRHWMRKRRRPVPAPWQHAVYAARCLPIRCRPVPVP